MQGIEATFHRDDQSRGLWGLDINGRMVVWLIDIRWQHEKDAHEAGIQHLQADGALICCAQKPDADDYGAKWLPLAATPGYTPPVGEVQKLFDCAFVGYVRDKPREQALLDLNQHVSLSIAQGQFGDAAVTTYHQARLGVNVPTRYGHPQAYDSANMRLFEILATGTPVVTPYEDYLSELGVEHGKTGFVYRNPQDLLDIVDKALSDFNLTNIGNNAVKLVRERHTYAHRAKQVMEWLHE